jgi:uroporphyrinogen-III synthase
MSDALSGLRVVAFEARRADEIATMLGRHGARVLSAPALREAPLGATPEALELARRLEAGEVDCLVLLTGVGTRALAAACPRIPELLARAVVVARGPKPLAALREIGVTGARPVAEPFTWRQVLEMVDGLGSPGRVRRGAGVRRAATRSAAGLARRGLVVLRVPVYRWALPEDTGPLRAGADALARGAAEVAGFTSAVQVEHLFRVAADAETLRAGLRRAVVASIGPVCSEALEAHGVPPDLEASPPKMGPLVALVAARAREVLAGKRVDGGGRRSH